jgi:hypothetical protein
VKLGWEKLRAVSKLLDQVFYFRSGEDRDELNGEDVGLG